MATLAEALADAVRYQKAGQLTAAEHICRQIVARAPDHVGALHLLGIVSSQLGKHELAIEVLERASGLWPTDASIQSNLGGAFRAQGKLDRAEAAFRRAIELRPDYALAHYNLGTIVRAQGNLPDAIASFRRAIENDPRLFVGYNNLGNALQEQGHVDEAVSYFRRALELKPNFVEAHNNLGTAFQSLQQVDQAIAAFRRALELNPSYALAHYNLGAVFQQQGNIDDAVSCFRRALELQPEYADAHNNLGIALQDQGQVSEAIVCYRRAIECKPDFVEAHSNLLYALYFCPGIGAEAIAAEHRVWNDKHAQPLAKCIQPHRNDPSPERRLRIGYVSPYFREHCQTFFTTELFRNHDRTQFEIACFSGVARPDAYTHRLRSMVDDWRDIVGMAPDKVAELVRHDRIDILVDLTMHMARGLPLVFAEKPAPIQACWLAYPGTTGLAAIDYRFTDPYLDPPSLWDLLYAEESIRLPHSFWCYDPLTEEPDVNRLPALENGYVTFGCLNSFSKVNRFVIEIWARIMQALPGSRLILLAPEGSVRQRTLQLFSKNGVRAERVTFVPFQPRPDYLATYNKIDIGLDTLPANGHTTSMDAFWMGVPVPTIVGSTAIGRGGLSLLTNLGLQELVAERPEQYVDLVGELAVNLPQLAELRITLRERMRASPLMDGPRFARDMEAAYRRIWKQWCAARR